MANITYNVFRRLHMGTYEPSPPLGPSYKLDLSFDGDQENGRVYCTLIKDTYTPNRDDTYSNVVRYEVGGGGYGGAERIETPAVTIDAVSHYAAFDGDDVTFSSITATGVRYALLFLYRREASVNLHLPLMLVDFGSSLSVTDADFVIQWSSVGIYVLAHVPSDSGNTFIYTNAKYQMLTGGYELGDSGDALKVVLLSALHSPDPEDVDYDDVSGDEITGAGYTTGGEDITGQAIGLVTGASGYGYMTCANTDWTSATFSATRMAIYNTTVDDELVMTARLPVNPNTGNNTWSTVGGLFRLIVGSVGYVNVGGQ